MLIHRLKTPTVAAVLAGGAVALMVGGCDDPPKGSALPRISPGTTRQLPGDSDTVYSASSKPGRPAMPVDANDPSPGPAYAVDAMVGQINGRPIYASEVFEEAGEEQLQALGRNNPPAEFRQQAAFLLSEKLRQLITDALILAEAEASLTEDQQVGLFVALQEFRGELISKAFGSEAIAEEQLQRDRGISLDEAVELHRQRMLTQRYLHEKLYPRVHVERRQVERFYKENEQRFAPLDTVVVAVLYTDDDRHADQIERRLDAGEDFDAVAGPYEAAGHADGVRYRPRMSFQTNLDEFDEFPDPVDAKVRQLSVGGHTGRIDTKRFVFFVKLVDVVAAEGQSLDDVFLQIEAHLRSQEFDQLNRRYLQKLFEDGNYTPLNQMMQSLLTVAVNRYSSSG